MYKKISVLGDDKVLGKKHGRKGGHEVQESCREKVDFE